MDSSSDRNISFQEFSFYVVKHRKDENNVDTDSDAEEDAVKADTTNNKHNST